MPELTLPHDGLVLLIGPSGCGKSTFAARHFAATEVLSSDAFRALLTDDPGDQSVSDDAFRLLHEVVGLRLERGRLTVVDATNVQDWARGALLRIARRHGRPAAAIVLDLPIELCLERNAERGARSLPAAAVRRQHRWLTESLPHLAAEGIDPLHVMRDASEVDAARIVRR